MERSFMPMLIILTLAIFSVTLTSLWLEWQLGLIALISVSIFWLYLKPNLKTLVVLLSAAVAGANAYWHIHSGMEHRLNSDQVGVELNLQVRVFEPPQVFSDFQKVVVKVISQDKNSVANETIPKLRNLWLYFDNSDNVKEGDIWEVSTKLKPPYGYQSDGAFSRKLLMFRNRIDASGTVRSSIRVAEAEGLSHLRNRLKHQVDESTQSPIAKAWIKSLVFGDLSDFNENQARSVRGAHIQHLLVVSGLHLGTAFLYGYLIAGLLVRFLPVVSPSIPSNILQIPAGLLLAASYALLCGFTIPTLRALIMIGMPSVIAIAKKDQPLLFGFCLAVIMILLVDPLAILSPGFWMSFSAVAILILGFSWRAQITSTSPLINKLSTLKNVIWRPQLLIFFGLTPVILSAGLGFNPFAFLINLALVPVFSIVVIPFTFIGMILNSFGLIELSSIFWWPIEMAAPLLTQWLPKVASYNLPIAIGFVQSLLLVCIGLCLVLPRSLPLKPLLLLVVCSVIWPTKHRFSGFEVVFFDVGQGQSVLVASEDQSLLYDTGIWVAEGFSAYSQVLRPWFHRRGIKSIDHLVISHGDLDHSGGADQVVTELRPDHIWAGEPNKSSNLAATQCQSATKFKLGKVTAEFLHPDQELSLEGNDASCVLWLYSNEYPENGVLLTGDITKAVEYRLIDKGVSPVDLVSVAHHGSKTSSSQDFLEQVNPKLAVVSSGPFNSFGHPNPEIVERFQEFGQVLNTADLGTLTFTFDTGQWLLKSHSKHQSYWLND